MTRDQRILSFSRLGSMLRSYCGTDQLLTSGISQETWNALKQLMDEAIVEAMNENGWFGREQIMATLSCWGSSLEQDQLELWLAPYSLLPLNKRAARQIGLVMAGNIPMVGFHDLLSVLISGHIAVIKYSSQDRRLLPVCLEWLFHIDPEWKERVRIPEGEIKPVDAIIATGSGNASRYFHYYFETYPHIIRKNRYGVAILTGNETQTDYEGLASDIFSFYGLGCRNVSSLLIPRQMDLTLLHQVMQTHHPVWHHHKYKHNYEYFKSLCLVNRTPFIDGGFYMLMEDDRPGTPVSVIHYSYYSNKEDVDRYLAMNADQIQCVVCREPITDHCVKPGETQSPRLWDYADGVDTIQFLSEKF